jgi:hypothetical protein
MKKMIDRFSFWVKKNEHNWNLLAGFLFVLNAFFASGILIFGWLVGALFLFLPAIVNFDKTFLGKIIKK